MSSRDTWNGQPLPERKRRGGPLAEDIHYRLYDQAGKLLSFNSTNDLNSIVADVERVAREHPTARIHAVKFDGPAYR
jgi:hypothetical protein